MALRQPSLETLVPFVPRVALQWAAHAGEQTWQVVDGSLVFVDISGFTALSERLARRGRVGAEELTDTLSRCFGELLTVAYDAGGSLLKFGGDALLLLFDGEHHARRGVWSAQRMQAVLAETGRVTISAGSVRLRMSVGVHSGPIHLFHVGASHRELIVTGLGATTTVAMEATADAGEIVVSPDTARLLDPRTVGSPKGAGFLVGNKSFDVVPAPARVPSDASDHAAACVPSALREELLAGNVDSEHRRAAVAFIHFDGVDDLVRAGDVDALASALDELVRDTQQAAEDHGVTFLATDADRDGGKIILVAGAPRARGDDAGRMLRTLRRVVDTPRALPVRIGVNFGPVFAGSVGPDFRRTYTVMGDTVNVAARLMASARPGQILATDAVFTTTRAHYALEAIPPLTLKGKAQPVEAMVVGARIDRREGVIDDHLPLTGRDREMAAIERVLEYARAGRGGLVEITGAPGAGKSRLLDEVCSRAVDFQVVKVYAEPFEAQTPYFATRFIVRALAGLDTTNASERLGRLRDVVGDTTPDLAPWLPLIATVADVDCEDTDATADLEPRFRRERTRQVVVEFVTRLVAGPVVLVVEDAQWLDRLSAEVLATLGRAALERPWLVCVARRIDADNFTLDPDSLMLQLKLDTLDDAAARAIVTAATRDTPLLPHIRDMYVERAGGNPLFLIELLRTHRDSGDVFPESLESVVAAEIDRLPASDRTLLRYAAVLGATFESRLLREITNGELATATTAASRFPAFLQSAGRGLIRFRNQCYRQVAYDTLPFSLRRSLHERAALAIERVGRDTDTNRAAVLSLHWYHAQAYDRCWHEAQAAAHHAADRFANAEAAELYERALAASRHLRDASIADVATVWESLGDVALLAGHFDRARTAFTRARRLYTDNPGALADLALKESRVAMYQGRRVAAQRWIHRGLQLIGDRPNKEQQARRAALRAMYANYRQSAGRPREVVRWAKLAIDDAIASGNTASLANAYLYLDWALVALGRGGEATHVERALELREAGGHVGRIAEALAYVGAFAYLEGRWDDALGAWARSSECFERAGNMVEAALGASNSAELLIGQGRYDQAEPRLEEALAIWRAARYPAVAGALCQQGRLAMYRGDFESADSLFAEAKRLGATTGGVSDIEIESWRAECALHQGDRARASSMIDECLRAEASSGDGSFAPRLLRLRAFAHLGADRPDRAREDFDQALELARTRGARYDVALTLDALIHVSARYGWRLDADVTAEREEQFAALGIVTAPPLPPI